jgi:hypothetical protein
MNSNQNIQRIQNTFTKVGILPVVEKLRYALSVINCHFKDKSFILENPHFELPIS